MSPTAKRIEIEVVGDVKNFQNSLGKAAGSADSFGSSLTRMAKYGALAIGAAGIGGLAVVLRSGIKEFAEASKVGAQTGAVLKSTGGAANVTAGQVSNLADSLMRKSGVDDEAIQSGSNLLLTFTRIRNEVGQGNDIFDQATKATLNLSVAMGKDMSSSAILVGKALNDPLKGMTALNKAGIQFTQSQKDSIKAMVEAGNTMGAQKMILKELETQFGGSAEAIGKTLPGQLNILKESFSNMAGELVGALVPAFSKVMASVSGFVQALGEADGARAKLDVVWGAITSGVEKVGAGIKSAFNSIDWNAVGNALVNGLKGALAFLGGIDYGGILRTVADKVISALKAAFNAIDWGAVGNAVGTALVKALNKIAEFVKSVDWNNVGQQLVHGIGVTIKALATFLAGVNWAAVLGALTKGIIAVLKGLAGLLLGIATALGAAIVSGIVAGLSGIAGKVQEKISAARQAIVDATGTAYANALGVGKAIVLGFIDGIASMAQAVADKAVEVARGAWEAAKNFLKIGSPSKLFEGIGADTIRGFILGISTQQPALEGKMKEAISKALDGAKAVVEKFQAAFGDAFGKLGDFAKRAFDAKTQNLLDNVSKRFDAQIAKWQKYADALTPAEKALEEMDKAEAQRSRDAATRAAGDALVQAQAMEEGVEKEKAVAAALEQIRQAELAVRRVQLEEKAAVERIAQETSAAAHIAALEATKARELTNLEERRTQLGNKLSEQLTTLQTRLAKHPEEYDKIQKQIVALLAKYGIPMEKAGENLGKAFAKGLRDSIPAAVAAAKALAKAVAQYMPHSPAEKGPLSKPIDWKGYLTEGLPSGGALAGMASGMVSGMAGGGGGPRMAMAGGGGGARQLIININAPIPNPRETARQIYNELRSLDLTQTGGRVLAANPVLR